MKSAARRATRKRRSTPLASLAHLRTHSSTLLVAQAGGAIETLEAVYAEMIDRGQESAAPGMLLYVVWGLVRRGELERAARMADEAREAAVLLEDPTVSGLALSASALVHAHDGRTALARTEAEQALELFEQVQWRVGATFPLWALGLALLSERDPAGVDRTLAPLADQPQGPVPRDPHALREATADGVFFTGDSAGHCLPLTAEGIRTALYFGLACGRELAAVLDGRQTREQALASYHAFSASHARPFRWMLRVQRLIPRVPPRFLARALNGIERDRLIAWSFGHYLNVAHPDFVGSHTGAAARAYETASLRA